MVPAATEFKKSGYSDEESAQLAQLASMFQNISDSEMEAGESASFIIAQMKAFNIEADDAIHILNSVNSISNAYAVSSTDLSENIGKVGSVLAATNTSMEEAFGLLTSITEITRNASTASRSLRQISSRLVQTLDETSGTGKKLIDIYQSLGIELKNNEGQLRSTYDILKDLASQWDNLSTNQKDYIALTSAGSNQVERLKFCAWNI